jgi:hypothetical protein
VERHYMDTRTPAPPPLFPHHTQHETSRTFSSCRTTSSLRLFIMTQEAMSNLRGFTSAKQLRVGAEGKAHG